MSHISLKYSHSFCQFYHWSNDLKHLKQSELTELVHMIDGPLTPFIQSVLQSMTQSCSWYAHFLGEALKIYFSYCSSLFHTNSPFMLSVSKPHEICLHLLCLSADSAD